MKTAGNSQIMRIIPLLITIFSLSLPAYAQYSGGTGYPNDPYQIATAEDLMLLGDSPEDYDKHFILTADIDLDPNLPGRMVFGMAVIAPDANSLESGFQGTTFTGVFDGNGHTISNLTIKGGGYLGLFGKLDSGAIISNLGLVDVDVNGTGYVIGGLAGRNHHGSITTTHSTGTVRGRGRNRSIGGLVGSNGGNITTSSSTCTVWGGNYGLYVGGLVGYNAGEGYNAGDIATSYSTGVVSGNEQVGGLVGRNGYCGNITTSYSTSTVMGYANVGGLVGENGIDSEIIDCYAGGSVAGTNKVGGLVGTNTCDSDDCIERGMIHRCYSTTMIQGDGDAVGGLVGWNKADIISCFWDTEASGMDNMCGDQRSYQVGCDDTQGRITAEMQAARTFLGWGYAARRQSGQLTTAMTIRDCGGRTSRVNRLWRRSPVF